MKIPLHIWRYFVFCKIFLWILSRVSCCIIYRASTTLVLYSNLIYVVVGMPDDKHGLRLRKECGRIFWERFRDFDLTHSLCMCNTTPYGCHRKYLTEYKMLIFPCNLILIWRRWARVYAERSWKNKNGKEREAFWNFSIRMKKYTHKKTCT